MLEFDKRRFFDLLRAAPEAEPLLESKEPNSYVQSLLDAFKEDGELDLTTIDFNAFELSHVTPVEYGEAYPYLTNGWIKGFIRFCRKAPALQLTQRTFF